MTDQTFFLPFKPGLQALEKAALRSRSVALRDVFARRASEGRFSFAELTHMAATSREVEADPMWMSALARVVALQNVRTGDHETSQALFGAVQVEAIAGDYLATYARLLLLLQQYETLGHLLTARASSLAADDALQLSLSNPALGSPWVDAAEWRARLTRSLADRGLRATHAQPRQGTPVFDTVWSDDGPAGSRSGELVSVVMTTYRTGPRLLGSVRSILAQTWGDVEILLVDDCSGPEYEEVLAEAAGLDERVRLIRMERNKGTYGGRNAALAQARGLFVTGHDDDDWAHPRRIERQLEPLLADTAVPATLSHAVWASDDLEIAPLGWPAVGKYAPSYLARRELVDRAGGYLSARKAADTELIRRVEAMTGAETMLLPEALSLYRTRPGSLSRAEFAPGWDHPARVAFWQLAAQVHDRIRAGEIEASAALTSIAIPPRFLSPGEVHAYDMVVVADFRTPPGRGGESIYYSDVEALVEEGCRVAVVQLDDVRATGRRFGPVDPRLRAMVNARKVDQVYLDDDVEAGMLLIRTAGLLQYGPPGTSSIRAGRVILVADESPRLGTDLGGYDVVDCALAAERLWDGHVEWMGYDEPLRQRTRAALAASTRVQTPVLDDVYRGATIVTGEARKGPPRRYPVVGVLLPSPAAATSEATTLATQVLPSTYPGEIRVWAPLKAIKAMGDQAHHWNVVDPGERSSADFLSNVDILAYYPERGSPDALLNDAFGSGCVVVTHPRFRASLGEAANYAWPSRVTHVYASISADPEKYEAAVTRSLERAQELLTPTALLGRLRSSAKVLGMPR